MRVISTSSRINKMQSHRVKVSFIYSQTDCSTFRTLMGLCLLPVDVKAVISTATLMRMLVTHSLTHTYVHSTQETYHPAAKNAANNAV